MQMPGVKAVQSLCPTPLCTGKQRFMITITVILQNSDSWCNLLTLKCFIRSDKVWNADRTRNQGWYLIWQQVLRHNKSFLLWKSDSRILNRTRTNVYFCLRANSLSQQLPLNTLAWEKQTVQSVCFSLSVQLPPVLNWSFWWHRGQADKEGQAPD